MSKNIPFQEQIFSQNRLIWVSKYPELLADFRSEGRFQKNAPKKDYPEKQFFPKKSQIPPKKSLGLLFFQCTFSE
jgi:hypothetical protein